MEVVILAGGLGTRLKNEVPDMPKPMANINGKPFLEYIMNHLNRTSVDKVVLSVGYKSDAIIDYFGSKFADLEIVYSIEDKPLGTGGAIKQAIEHTSDEFIYVLNGDTLFDVNLLSLRNFSLFDAEIVVALKALKNTDRYGFVSLEQGGRINSFSEKKQGGPGLINGGVYMINRKIFDRFCLNNSFSFEDFLENNCKEVLIAGLVFENYFIDIGIPKDYQRAQFDIGEMGY